MKTRMYFLDNLRTFLIFLVVLLHAGISYSHGMDSFWIVVDPQKSEPLALVNMYLDLFVMFIIFFISGYFIPYSVKSKNTMEFLKSKFQRIMVPWFIAVFTLIPAYKAIFLFSRGMPQQEWYSYFTFFHRAGTDLNFYANSPTLNWLWFLPVLFLFQVIYLALSKTNVLSLNISLKTGVILTFVIGLISSMLISIAGLKGWFHSPLLDFQRERLLIYFMSFLLGTLCFKLKVFDSNEKNMKYYIISNVVLTISLGVFTAVALNLFFNILDPMRNYFIVSETIDKVTYYATALLSMLTFLHVFIHLFRFSFNKTNSIMNHLNKSSYQVYIIHLIVLGFLALAMINLQIAGFIKFVLLTMLTYIISNGIVIAYHRWFQQNMSLRFGTFTILVVALFAFIRFGNKVSDNGQLPVAQTVVMLPAMGIHEAVITGNMEVIQQYIHTGADLDEKDPMGGSSPLITAAVFGKSEIAMALINAGADVNFKNNEGSTPLHTAAFFCRTEIVDALLAKGADVSIKNNAGSIAWDAVSGPFESVKGIYDYFKKAYGPMGLELDDEQLKTTRPVIATMIKNHTSD
jgi:peptidoglycan/LPS O-acetylase OafA/YrhL